MFEIFDLVSLKEIGIDRVDSKIKSRGKDYRQKLFIISNLLMSSVTSIYIVVLYTDIKNKISHNTCTACLNITSVIVGLLVIVYRGSSVAVMYLCVFFYHLD